MSSYVQSAQKAEGLKKELDALPPMKKEDEDRLWQKFRLEWNYNSNHIEGNTLTYSETKLLIIFGKTSGTHEIRDFDEMRAHDTAVKLVREWASEKDRNLTESDIRTLNEIILVRPFWKEAITPDGQQTRRLISIGKYKEQPNSVLLKNGEIFQFASPDETPAKMEDLMKEYYKDIDRLHPFQLAAEFHYKFVRIHPFDDGNGRVARLIMNYILLKAGYPPVIIKSEEKEQYYDALQKADSGDRVAFMEYITDQLSWSLDITIRAAKGQSIEEDADIDKEFDLLKLQITGNQYLQEKKSGDKSIEILKNVLVPFFQEVGRNLAKVNDMFLTHSLNVGVHGHNQFKNIDLFSPNWEDQAVFLKREGPLDFYEIKLAIQLKGFKHGLKAGDLYLEIRVYFEEYKYIINYQQSQNRTELDKFYHESLTNEEKKMLIREIKIEVNEWIKRASNTMNS